MARSSDSQYDYMSLYIYKKCCNQCYTGYTPNVLSGPTPLLPRALPIVYYTQQYYIQLYIGAGYEKKHGQVSALSPPLTHYLHGLFPKFFFTSTLVNFHLANGGSQLLIPLLGYFFLQQNIRVDPRKSRTHNFKPVFKIFSCWSKHCKYIY